jgi:hypothetical protein
MCDVHIMHATERRRERHITQITDTVVEHKLLPVLYDRINAIKHTYGKIN